MTENCKFRKAILSAFYNISQRNFGILLILWCSFKLWWNFCLDQNLVYNANGPLKYLYITSYSNSLHLQSKSFLPFLTLVWIALTEYISAWNISQLRKSNVGYYCITWSLKSEVWSAELHTEGPLTSEALKLLSSRLSDYACWPTRCTAEWPFSYWSLLIFCYWSLSVWSPKSEVPSQLP
jgi:hypothetical protein